MILNILILTRIIVNPLSNVFQKKLVHNEHTPLFIIFFTYLILAVATFPFLKILIASLSLEFLTYIFACSIFAVSGNALLVKALKYGDLSVLGPVNSYKSILSLVLGIFLIHEIPGLFGLCGVILILIGSYVIADRKSISEKQNRTIVFFRNKGVQLRLAALILTGIEAIYLKKAILLATPISTFIAWCLCGFVVSGVAILFTSIQISDAIKDLKPNTTTLIYLTITTGLMQLSTLLIFNKMQVGYSLALFQTSSILSVLLGYKYFKEKNIKRRLVGSFIMITGSVLIITFK